MKKIRNVPILALLLASIITPIFTAFADDPQPPCWPNCPTNVEYTPPVFIPIEYPLNALLVRKSIIAFSDPSEADAFLAVTNFPFVKTTNNTLIYGGAVTLVPGFNTNSNYKVAVYTTNTVANHLYLNEFADALSGPWFQYTDTWTNQVNTEHLDYAYISNPGSVNGFFRTRDVTLQWLSIPVNRNQPGASTCGGNFQSSAIYWNQGQGTNWGFTVDPNTSVHKITVIGHPNVHIAADPLGGSVQCGQGEMTLTGNFSQWHFFVCYDGDPGPTCTVMFTGFKQF